MPIGIATGLPSIVHSTPSDCKHEHVQCYYQPGGIGIKDPYISKTIGGLKCPECGLYFWTEATPEMFEGNFLLLLGQAIEEGFAEAVRRGVIPV